MAGRVRFARQRGRGRGQVSFVLCCAVLGAYIVYSGIGRQTVVPTTGGGGASGGVSAAQEAQQEKPEAAASTAASTAKRGSQTVQRGGQNGGVKTVCQDSCAGRANNGVCDEGRPDFREGGQPGIPVVFEVHCDLGTDCGDCGPWVHTNSDGSDSWRPVEEIKAKGFEVFARLTLTKPPFWMAYTDPVNDYDVSFIVQNTGLLEMGFTWAWHKLLKDGCRGPGGKPQLVVDVGANFGYYSLLAASMGCRVVAWEPVPYFAAFFKYGLLHNNYTQAVQLRDAIVGNVSGQELTIEVPQRGIWGTAGIGGKNIDRAIDNQGEYDQVVRPVERVDEVVKEDVLIMKVDVEGFEPMVLQSAKNLLLKHRVEHLFMEYSPGVAERNFDWKWLESNPVMLMGLIRHGYTILHMDGEFREQWPEWEGDQPLPKMHKVTESLLQHDIQDAWRLQENTLGCHLQTDKLAGLPAFMFGCGALPEGVHPHSFRSSFGFNTNLWAFLTKPDYASIGSPASQVPLDFDIQHHFFVPGGTIGAGHRLCIDVAPEDQVMHRCPCSKPEVCGELEKRVRQLAAEGLLPPFPLEGRVVHPAQLSIDSW